MAEPKRINERGEFIEAKNQYPTTGRRRGFPANSNSAPDYSPSYPTIAGDFNESSYGPRGIQNVTNEGIPEKQLTRRERRRMVRAGRYSEQDGELVENTGRRINRTTRHRITENGEGVLNEANQSYDVSGTAFNVASKTVRGVGRAVGGAAATTGVSMGLLGFTSLFYPFIWIMSVINIFSWAYLFLYFSGLAWWQQWWFGDLVNFFYAMAAMTIAVQFGFVLINYLSAAGIYMFTVGSRAFKGINGMIMIVTFTLNLLPLIPMLFHWQALWLLSVNVGKVASAAKAVARG